MEKFSVSRATMFNAIADTLVRGKGCTLTIGDVTIEEEEIVKFLEHQVALSTKTSSKKDNSEEKNALGDIILTYLGTVADNKGATCSEIYKANLDDFKNVQQTSAIMTYLKGMGSVERVENGKVITYRLKK